TTGHRAETPVSRTSITHRPTSWPRTPIAPDHSRAARVRRLSGSSGIPGVPALTSLPPGAMTDVLLPLSLTSSANMIFTLDGAVVMNRPESGTAQDGRPLATLEDGTGPVYGVALSADARLLACGGLDGTVRVWAADSPPSSAALPSAWRLQARLEAHTG